MNIAFIYGTGNGRCDSFGITRKLSSFAKQSEGEVFVFIRGKEINEKYRAIAENGVHRVFVCDTNQNSFIEMCRLWIMKYEIQLIVLQDTEEGKKMASVLAMMLEGGLTADCINIEYDKKEGFQFFRAALGDSIIAKIKCIHTNYQICTVKQNVFHEENKTSYDIGTIEYIKPEKRVEEAKVRVLSRKKIVKKSISIANAERVFCFGRGIGSKEEVEKLRSLAELCDAEVAGTRAVVENELLEEAYQVGQSGSCIAPNLYVGFGISGASQHVIGIKNSKLVIAVNRDEKAPIFDYSDYILVEDCQKLIDCLLEKLYTKEQHDT